MTRNRILVTALLVPALLLLTAATAGAFWRTTATGTGVATAGTWTSGTTATVVFSPVTAGSGHRNVFSGTTTVKTGALTIEVFSGSTATGTVVKSYPATITQTGSSPWSWTVTTVNNDLTASSQYTARATQVDGTATSNQPTRTFNAA